MFNLESVTDARTAEIDTYIGKFEIWPKSLLHFFVSEDGSLWNFTQEESNSPLVALDCEA